MSEVKIAVRYAKALLAKAKEDKTNSQINEDMTSFTELCKASAEFTTLLKSPIVKTTDKQAAIGKICSSFNPTTLSFFNLVSNKNRTNLMDSIAQEYVKLNNIENSIVAASVTSSVELASEHEAQVVEYIKKKSNAKEVVLEKIVDEEIIGGIIIRFGDYLLDNSISSQINDLKKELNIS